MPSIDSCFTSSTESELAVEVAVPARILADRAIEWAIARRVAVEGWSVRYREAGTGPVVVLLHGLAVSADYWWRNGPPHAAAGYRVLAPDLPGFGLTEGPRDGLSIEEQARALSSWAAELGIEHAVYVGHSLSCQTSLQFAAWFPERVAGLILAAPTGDPSGRRLARQALGLLRDVPRESWRLRLLVAEAYLRAGFVRAWRTWRDAATNDALATAEAVRAPGVVVLGTRDPVVRGEFAESLASRLPRGRVILIAGGAHAVIYDTAEAFNAAVCEFIDELEGYASRVSK